MLGADYVGTAKQYANDVIAGDIIACKWVKAAAKRFLNDLKNCKAKGWIFSEEEVWSACDFAERMPHVEGTWDTATITLEPWQIFSLVNVFGFRMPDGTRRFNTVYIEVARKNAKSTLTSAVALYGLCMENEAGPQIKIAAPTGRQARIVFNVAKKMANKCPDLLEAVGLSTFANAILCSINDGEMGPINSKASTQDGLNPHWSIIDELHAHKSRALFDVLKSARGARKNPMSWYITTAGDNVEGVCYEQREIVTKILDGLFEADHFFGIIYTLDEDDDPFDETVWIKANPNLGVSVQLKELREFAAEAKVSPKSLGEFKTKRLNIWLSAAQAWLNVELWKKCGKANLSLSDFEGQDCWIALDLSARDDITAKYIVFWKDDIPYCFARFYLPRKLVEEKAKTVGTHYQVWADAGHLVLTEGDWISREVIQAELLEDMSRFNVRFLGFDQYSGAQTMAEDLQDDCGGQVIIFPKTAKNFTAPALEMESRIKVGRIIHDGNPVMDWMVSNAVVERRADKSILPKKPSAMSPQKIDGVDALITALAGAITIVPYNSTGSGSVYESRGVITA